MDEMINILYENWVALVSIIVLLALSGFFSGSETALTAASPALMHEKEKDNDRKASLVNKLFDKQEQLIGAILLGNNLVNILATAISTSLLTALFGQAGVAYATLVMTLLVLIFSEILPKTYAIRNPNKMALFVSPTMTVLVKLFSPIVRALQWIVQKTLRLFGAGDSGEIKGGGIEELRGAIDMQHDKEIKQERKMLKSVLDLADVDVYDVMVHRKNLFSIDASKPVDEIVEEVLSAPYSRIPIWRERPENIIGIIRAKRLFKALQDYNGDIEDFDIETVSAKPWFILETTNLMQQLQSFKSKREHFALVVDEYGALQGVVTLEDVLEEIVGDINDETDLASIDITGVRPMGDGAYLVDGIVTIRDLNRRFDWNLPDEEAATIAGLLIHETERIPEEKQKYVFHDFEFTIVERKKNQITSIKIKPLFAKEKKGE
jgi:Mg2+/Co2+ transporter CorB